MVLTSIRTLEIPQVNRPCDLYAAMTQLTRQLKEITPIL